MLDKLLFVLKEIKEVITLTVEGWLDDNMMLHAAGLAFYTIFSLAPLVILIIALAGIFFGEQAVSGQLSIFMIEILGAELAASVEAIVVSVYQGRSGLAATVAGSAILVFTATTVITQLKESLNTIWGVQTPKGKSIALFFINRALAVLLIIIFSFTLVTTIILDYLLGFIDPFVGDYIPPALAMFGIVNNFVFLLITTILFAIIYKMLPDIKVEWSDVFVGAFVTALLFLFGHYMVGFYLNNAATVSTFGAAGSFVVFLIWVYYNMLVIFFGAEFTNVYTIRYGSNIKQGIFVRWAERSLRKNRLLKSKKESQNS